VLAAIIFEIIIKIHHFLYMVQTNVSLVGMKPFCVLGINLYFSIKVIHLVLIIDVYTLYITLSRLIGL
jgi:hypothetical protein